MRQIIILLLITSFFLSACGRVGPLEPLPKERAKEMAKEVAKEKQ